jgi:hypothetical protein
MNYGLLIYIQMKILDKLISLFELKNDTGMRVRPNGSIYVNKKVFFSRKEVKDNIQKLKK